MNLPKWICCTGAFLLMWPLFAQRGDELLVYAVKGKVTAIYKKKETAVKIGKVLMPGSVIRTEKDASLTMLCTKGKPISLSREGSFPVSRWRDSCRVTQNSITSNYFRYIWDQLYSYSPEHQEELRRKNNMAVSRGEPFPGPLRQRKFTKLEFVPGMDTVNYDGNPFPLSWKGSGYKGYYHFTLYGANGVTVLFRDSSRNNFISTDSFARTLVPGQQYYWMVEAAGVPASRKRVLNFVTGEEAMRVTETLLQPLSVTEDSATASFRVAYMLEQKHFLSAALQWYIQAAEQDPEMELYRDRLIYFRNTYWIR